MKRKGNGRSLVTKKRKQVGSEGGKSITGQRQLPLYRTWRKLKLRAKRKNLMWEIKKSESQLPWTGTDHEPSTCKSRIAPEA